MATEYALKIREAENMSKVIKTLRAFDPSLSIGEIRKRISENDFVVKYDLFHWDITEEMEGIDRISRLKNLIRTLEECGTKVDIYDEDELISRTLFNNSMVMLREIEQETQEAVDREAEE
ncbi:MAG: hypothetical protein IKE18_00130 [Oscillospiraceae bacterium]|nr:hypothetical protein [Oscillospiraceae bacterium]